MGKNAVKGREYFDTNGIIVLFLQQIITEGSEKDEERVGRRNKKLLSLSYKNDNKSKNPG